MAHQQEKVLATPRTRKSLYWLQNKDEWSRRPPVDTDFSRAHQKAQGELAKGEVTNLEGSFSQTHFQKMRASLNKTTC